MTDINAILDEVDSNTDLLDNIITTTADDEDLTMTTTTVTTEEDVVTTTESADVPDGNEVPTAPVVAEVKNSKASVAVELYKAGKKAGKARKDIIKDFIEKAGLTKAGAATYYQTYEKKVKEGKLSIA